MKKSLLKMLSLSFILAVFAGFTGCNSENVDWEPAEISVNPTEITFEAGDVNTTPAPIEVEVASSRNWTVSEDMADWIDVSVERGSEGRTAVTIYALANPTNKAREGNVTFMTGQRLTAVLKVKQKGEGGVEPGVAIYREDVGTKVEKVDNAWPFVDVFTGWSREVTPNQAGVTYTGDAASVRNSGGAYQPSGEVATGAPYVFLGGGAPFFQINKINIAGHSNFTLNMAVSYENEYVSGAVTFHPITSASFKLQGSVDGTTWTALSFVNDATAGWVVTTTEFKTDVTANELYIRISEPATASKMRFDDFTLTEGGSGTIVIGEVVTEPKATTGDATTITDVTATLNGSFATPEGVTATEVGFEYKTGAGAFVAVPAAAVTPSFSVGLSGLTASTLYTYKAYVKTASGTAYGEEKSFTTTSGGGTGDVIYSENVGTTVEKIGTAWPFVDEFTGWSKRGTPNQTGVAYTGVAASVRNSGAAYQPAEGVASGAPYVFLGKGVPHFLISKIDITGNSNFTFKTAVSYENAYVSGSVTFHPITSTSFKLEGSVDGATWTALTFTNAATEGWVVTTSEFKTNGTANELYIRISEPATESKMRFDDFTLTSGGAGTIVIGGGTTPVPSVVTGAASAIAETTATLAGTYTLPTGAAAVTEVGVAWKKTGDATFTKIPAPGAVAGTEFTVPVTGLLNATGYTYYAYALSDREYVGMDRTFTTTSGGGGGEIYLENVGTTVEKIGTAWPFVDVFTGWSRAGTPNQTGVAYTGVAASVRNSGNAYQPAEGVASGAPYVFLGKGVPHFLISKIDITGHSNFTFKTAVSYENAYVSGSVTFHPITSTSFKLEGSVDGTTWTALTFTNAATEGWVVTTSEFKTNGTANELYIRISEPATESKMRFDDFTLTSGGAGTIVIGGGGTTPVPSVVTGAASAIAETTATLAGTYTLPTGAAAVTEVGVAWKKTGDATFTKIPAPGAVAGTEFTVPVTGLLTATGYTYYAYVLSDREYVGSERQFSTVNPTKTYITLAELRAKGATTVGEDVYVKGSVISGTNSSSIKNIVISDGAAGIAIRFVADCEFAEMIGKEIEISLNGAVLAMYNGLLQINGLPNAQAVATGETKLIAATPITSAQLLSGNFESMYVAVSDVQVVKADLAKTVGNATTNTSIMIESLTDEFVMYTARYADFVADAVPTGSGVLKGVASVNAATYQICPQTRADYSAMTGARLPFPLVFGDADFVGTLKTGDVASGNIVIPYTYAEGTENYNITVVVGDVAAAGVTVAPMTATITVAGDGQIEIPVTGTPTIEGAITFMVSGITGLTNNVASSVVKGAAGTGPFVAHWNMFGIPAWGDSPMAVTAVDNSMVSIGDLTKYNFTTSGAPGNNNWGGFDFAGNTDPMATTNKYAEFTVSAATGVLSLESIEAIIRITKTGPIETSVQYTIDGGTYVEASKFTYARPTGTTTFAAQTIDLSGIAALQNIAQGKVVTIRIVPLSTTGTTTGNWYLSSKDAATHALVVKGNAQ